MIQLWDTDTWQRQLAIRTHYDSIYTLAFSPDGKTIASGGGWHDNVLRMWDVYTGEHKNALRGHTGSVTAITFSPDGETVATMSQDDTIRVWI